MIRYFFCVALLFLLVSCNTDNNRDESIKKYTEYQDSTETIVPSDTVHSKYDGLILNYQSQISEYYNNYHEDKDKLPELKLEGSVGKENQDFLIISFYEIIKFGSWHTSRSSFVFKKLKDSSLVRILPNEHDTITDPNWDRALAYQHRINGLPYIITDLNNDGVDDFIFESVTSVRDAIYTEYSFYIQKNNQLKKSNLFFTGEIYQCDGFCGTKYQVSIKNEENSPQIIVREEVLKNDSITHDNEKVYMWRQTKNDFVLN